MRQLPSTLCNHRCPRARHCELLCPSRAIYWTPLCPEMCTLTLVGLNAHTLSVLNSADEWGGGGEIFIRKAQAEPLYRRGLTWQRAGY